MPAHRRPARLQRLSAPGTGHGVGHVTAHSESGLSTDGDLIDDLAVRGRHHDVMNGRTLWAVVRRTVPTTGDVGGPGHQR
ncbi:hypothetical protein [Streptomyces sp. NPDC001292]|uniref:hypothetical protein n=1 Tax=Streptomyces sp. NPDC001292 TaxID=3364558 RepID=UPI003689E78B